MFLEFLGKKYENSSTLCQKLLDLFQNDNFQTFQFFTSHEERISPIHGKIFLRRVKVQVSKCAFYERFLLFHNYGQNFHLFGL